MTRHKSLLYTLMLAFALAAGVFAPIASAQEKVNINTADAATIDKVLVNVGPAKAEAIVAYRKQNGAFKSLDQLANVKGIGLKTIEKNRDRILLGAPRVAAASPRKPGVAAKAPAKK